MREPTDTRSNPYKNFGGVFKVDSLEQSFRRGDGGSIFFLRRDSIPAVHVDAGRVVLCYG